MDRSRRRRGDNDCVGVVVIISGANDDGDSFFEQLPSLNPASVCPALCQGGPPRTAPCVRVSQMREMTLEMWKSRFASIKVSQDFVPTSQKKKKKNSTNTSFDLLAAMPSAALASRYEALFRDSLAELELLVKKEEEQEEEGEEDVDEAKEEEKEEDLGAEEGDEEEEEDDQRAQRAEASRRRFESARGPLEKATVAIAELRRAVEGKKKSGLFFVAPGESGGDAASAVAAELAALLSAAYA